MGVDFKGENMRWWKEFWSPKLKCKRLGCDIKVEKITIRREDSGYGCVAKDFTAERDVCSRCGFKGEPKNEEYKTYWTKVTMSSSYFDEMEEKGYIILD